MAVTLNITPAGTIGEYSDLVTKVGQWLDRDDLEDRIPDFCALLESRLNRLLRTLNMETQSLLVVTGETYTLPSDFRMMRSLHIEGSPDRPLREMAPAAIPNSISGEAGIPQSYWLRNRVLVLAPPPSDTTTLNAVYYRRVPPLTASEPLNWVLEEYPDIYVWGVLEQAAIYLRDPEAIALCKDRLDEAIAELQVASRRDRYGGGPLVPNTTRQVRGARC